MKTNFQSHGHNPAEPAERLGIGTVSQHESFLFKPLFLLKNQEKKLQKFSFLRLWQQLSWKQFLEYCITLCSRGRKLTAMFHLFVFLCLLLPLKLSALPQTHRIMFSPALTGLIHQQEILPLFWLLPFFCDFQPEPLIFQLLFWLRKCFL